MSDEIANKITENAVGPAAASGDGVSVTQHKLTDQIAADKHADRRAAAARRGLPLRFGRLRPPGAA